jgi:hypothetical protein
MKVSKYRNQKTEVNGITFDSKKEALRYGQLRLLEKLGLIQDLKLQVKFPLVVSGVKIGSYICDFQYQEGHTIKTEDVKGMRTPVYNLKKKLVKALYGIDIREV